MTSDEKIEAEVRRIMAQPHDEQVDAIVSLIRTLPRDQRDQIVAYMRASTSGVTQRAPLVASRFAGEQRRSQ
jgi:hypothetical protein